MIHDPIQEAVIRGSCIVAAAVANAVARAVGGPVVGMNHAPEDVVSQADELYEAEVARAMASISAVQVSDEELVKAMTPAEQEGFRKRIRAETTSRREQRIREKAELAEAMADEDTKQTRHEREL